MVEKVLMIALSPTMETGTIVKWNKKEGDAVESGEVLCEVETDKATMEYESAQEGNLLKILVQEGEEARIEDPIAIIGEKGEDVTDIMREIGETRKKVHVPEEEILEEEKQSAVIAAEEEQGGGEAEGEVAAVSESPGIALESREKEEAVRIKASPLARQLAQQHRLDLKLVKGSGPDGRVVKRDIEVALRQTPARLIQKPAPSAVIAPEEIPLSGKRKVIAQRISESKFSAPHYYLRIVVEVDNLMAARTRLNKGGDEKVSLNAFLIKFTAEALKRHRIINASWGGDRIIQFGTADIGIAVAQPDGLITPIVRDCWSKGIIQIDKELKVLVDKALNNRLRPQDYQGATFTISNLGTFGIREFTAIINPPGSAILAVGQIRREPMVDEGDNISVKSTMILTLSCDHRVFDGAAGALFLKELKEIIEYPIKFLY
jgi:pyruvate dehydrogenase E2 component (dihydrolipoamide acetyltransferase)